LLFVGANTVFALNALCFLAVLISIAPWKPQVSKVPLESFFESVATAIRYVRYSQSVRIILIRYAIFSFFVASCVHFGANRFPTLPLTYNFLQMEE
jgi:hypothetical protein